MSQASDGDDRDLEAFLARDSALQRRWRDAAGDDEPPAALDATVRAAARRAVGAGPRPSHGPFSGRWRVPLSIAAVVVVSVTVSLMVADRRDHLPDAGLNSASPPAPAEQLQRSAPIEAPAQEAAESKAASAADLGAARGVTQPVPDAQTAAEQPAPEGVAGPAEPRRAPQPFPDLEKDAAAAPRAKLEHERETPLREEAADRLDAPAPRVRAARPAAPPAPAGAVAWEPDTGRTQEAPVSHVPAAAPVADALRDEPPAPGVAPAPQAEAPAKRRAEEARRFEQAEVPAAAKEDTAESPDAAEADPQRWIERIRAMRRAGKREQAEESLREFRQRYPEYPLPTDLQEPR